MRNMNKRIKEELKRNEKRTNVVGLKVLKLFLICGVVQIALDAMGFFVGTYFDIQNSLFYLKTDAFFEDLKLYATIPFWIVFAIFMFKLLKLLSQRSLLLEMQKKR